MSNMKIGIVCYPTYGGSGVVATELGKALANELIPALRDGTRADADSSTEGLVVRIRELGS